MTTFDHASAQEPTPGGGERHISPDEVRGVHFPRAGVLQPGYEHTEVDAFLVRVSHDLNQLLTENAALRGKLHDLEDQLTRVVRSEPPSEQAVRILAVAQQTADNYVAEAEDFSRQVTADARAQYDERLREARENAGAIIQAAQEAAARVVAEEGGAVVGEQLTTEELQEQVAYLRAFGKAVRVQLRSYLEALLTDVESEWGRAHPTALPPAPVRRPGQRADNRDESEPLNVVVEVAADAGPAGNGNGAVEVTGAKQ